MDVGRSGTDEGGLGEERGWGMYGTRKGDRPQMIFDCWKEGKIG